MDLFQSFDPVIQSRSYGPRHNHTGKTGQFHRPGTHPVRFSRSRPHRRNPHIERISTNSADIENRQQLTHLKSQSGFYGHLSLLQRKIQRRHQDRNHRNHHRKARQLPHMVPETPCGHRSVHNNIPSVAGPVQTLQETFPIATPSQKQEIALQSGGRFAFLCTFSMFKFNKGKYYKKTYTTLTIV